MTKAQKIKKYFDQRERLKVTDRAYRTFLKSLVDVLINTDLGDRGDVTTNALISPTKRITAQIVTSESGIVAGIDELQWLFHKRFSIRTLKRNGDRMKSHDVILILKGRARDILTYERIILNILQRMSGIATATSELVARAGGRCLVCPTRKTPLGLLDKKAVALGGGGTHRLGLHDFILIKENHLALLDQPLSKFSFKGFWEIEVENEKQAIEYAKLNPSAMMFDNMSPARINRVVQKLPRNIIFEASGGITDSKIVAYAKTGVDIISLGALTHSVRALDMGLDIL